MEMVEVKETESAIKEIEGLTEGNNKSDHKVALTDFVNYIHCNNSFKWSKRTKSSSDE